MELDHIFLFVSGETMARKMMDDAGLRVNYARAHPGQGTQNLCACFDNVFLELLWLDGTEISTASQAIGLEARGQGKGSPIGISWRGSTTLETMPYHAPFLPEGISIPVAAASADLSLPFVFQTPGGTPPIDRTDGLVGGRQAPEYTRVKLIEIKVPNLDNADALIGSYDLIKATQGQPSINIAFEDANNGTKTINWVSDLTDQLPAQ